MKRNLQHPISVLGLPLDSLTATGAVEAIDGLIRSGGTHQIATANLDFWLNSLSDRHLHRIIAGCSLVLPDGMPLVWVSKLLGCPLAERVTGVDMVPALAELAVRKNYGIFLLGGKGNVAERAKAHLEQRFPGVRIVGTFAPTVEEMAQADHSEILNRIQATRPEILLVALGNPKQEKWIWTHRKRLGVPVAMGVGGSFEIMVGDMTRAPRWVQKCGLEWAMRFMQEPGRLGPRYFRDFAGLAKKMPQTLIAAWMQRKYKGESHLATVSNPQSMHVYLHGKLDSNMALDFVQATNACIANGLVMVVHLQSVRQITAAGLGLLLDVRRQVLDEGLSLSLTGLSLRQRFLLRAWCAQPLFDEWEETMAQGRSMAKEPEPEVSLRLETEADALTAETRVRG
jgi:N-acetylglucosaminyldiphosphoundecaprenol N-acetyl-beta-D-mannosaminyltransferase